MQSRGHPLVLVLVAHIMLVLTSGGNSNVFAAANKQSSSGDNSESQDIVV